MMNKWMYTLICMLFASSLYAQDDVYERVIKKEVYDSVPDAERHYEKVNYKVESGEVGELTYDTRNAETELPEVSTKIKIPKVKIPDENLEKYYFELGYGNYATTYAEAYANTVQNDRFNLGVYAKHLASKNGPVDKNNSGTGENALELHGKFFTDKTVFYGNAGYQRNKYSYYGYDEKIPEPDADSLEQIYNRINVLFGLKNNESQTLNYHANIGFKYLFDHYSATEWQVLHKNAFEYKADFGSLFLNSDIAVTQYQDTSSISRNYFAFNPGYKTKFNNIELEAGLNLAIDNDTTDNGGFHLYPNISASMGLLENQLTLFGGLKGELTRNTLSDFAQENPYLAGNAFLHNTSNTLNIFGGVRGTVAKKITYLAQLSHKTFQYLPVYINGIADTSQFLVVYDPDNVTQLNLSGEVAYRLHKTLNIGLRGDYYSYNMGDLEKAWHRPSATAGAFIGYNWQEKLRIKADIYYIGGIVAKNFVSNEAVKLDAIIDLNLRAEYRFTDKISVFLQGGNLLNKSYERLLYYPVKQIQFLGGVTFSY